MKFRLRTTGSRITRFLQVLLFSVGVLVVFTFGVYVTDHRLIEWAVLYAKREPGPLAAESVALLHRLRVGTIIGGLGVASFALALGYLELYFVRLKEIVVGRINSVAAATSRVDWIRNTVSHHIPLRYNKEALVIFLALFVTYGYFLRGFSGDNANSRLDLVFALVHEGRLTIDSFHDTPGMFTMDKSFYNGHYYSDKAIGTAVLGTIVYLPLYWIGLILKHQASLLYAGYLINLCAVAFPSAFAGSLIYLVSEHISRSKFRAYVVTMAIALGTMALPFSTLFFEHQLTASVLFIGFFIILRWRVNPQQGSNASTFLVGLLLGFALITSYPSVIIVAPVTLYYLYVMKDRKPFYWTTYVVAPAIGMLIPLVIYLGYNTLVFGTPFTNAYRHLVDNAAQRGMGQGIMGVGWPRGVVLYYITFHPIRGLFFQSPVLIAALYGWYFMYKEKKFRIEALLSATALIGYLLMNSGYYQWWGGASSGPRHLIPMIPFLALPLSFFPVRYFSIVIGLTVVSIFQMFIVTAQNPLTSCDPVWKMLKGNVPGGLLPWLASSPIWYSIKHLYWGEYAMNLGNVLGLHGLMSLVPLVVMFVAANAVLFVLWQQASGHVQDQNYGKNTKSHMIRSR
jgi:hypothetical protein